MALDRRSFLVAVPAAIAGAHRIAIGAPAAAWATKLIVAATAQIGVTVTYDLAYSRIAFPGGDVPRDRGVCTDVVIRAYRDAFRLDLQKLVHDDMRGSFSAYPKTWGLTRPDSNIDHRRVPNLETFLARKGAVLPITADASDYRPGDLVTQRLPGNLPHTAIVGAQEAPSGRPLLIHNIGAGACSEDILFAHKIAGHFRFAPLQ